MHMSKSPEYMKKYREDHREHLREYKREWKKYSRALKKGIEYVLPNWMKPVVPRHTKELPNEKWEQLEIEEAEWLKQQDQH